MGRRNWDGSPRLQPSNMIPTQCWKWVSPAAWSSKMERCLILTIASLTDCTTMCACGCCLRTTLPPSRKRSRRRRRPKNDSQHIHIYLTCILHKNHISLSKLVSDCMLLRSDCSSIELSVSLSSFLGCSYSNVWWFTASRTLGLGLFSSLTKLYFFRILFFRHYSYFS